jgi:hypothetical protein
MMKRLLGGIAVVGTLAGAALAAAAGPALAQPAGAFAQARNSHVDFAVVGCSEDGNEIIVKWTLVSHVPEVGTIVDVTPGGAGAGIPLHAASESVNIDEGEHIDAADVTSDPPAFGVMDATQNIPKDRAGTSISLRVTIDYAAAANEEPAKQAILVGCGLSNPTAPSAVREGEGDQPASGASIGGPVLVVSGLLTAAAVLVVVAGLLRRRRGRPAV